MSECACLTMNKVSTNCSLTEEILNGKLHFLCSQFKVSERERKKHYQGKRIWFSIFRFRKQYLLEVNYIQVDHVSFFNFSQKKFKETMKFNVNFVFGIYLCVISIISLPLNTVVLIALVKGRKKIRRLWIPLISLPISNILQVCAAHPLAITTGFRGDWIFGEFGINWFSFISGLCGFSNIFIHAVLSLER